MATSLAAQIGDGPPSLPARRQEYFVNNPNQGYCAFVVGPKVEKFQKTFASKVKG